MLTEMKMINIFWPVHETNQIVHTEEAVYLDTIKINEPIQIRYWPMARGVIPFFYILENLALARHVQSTHMQRLNWTALSQHITKVCTSTLV